jgi:hypothetical protein
VEADQAGGGAGSPLVAMVAFDPELEPETLLLYQDFFF